MIAVHWPLPRAFRFCQSLARPAADGGGGYTGQESGHRRLSPTSSPPCSVFVRRRMPMKRSLATAAVLAAVHQVHLGASHSRPSGCAVAAPYRLVVTCSVPNVVTGSSSLPFHDYHTIPDDARRTRPAAPAPAIRNFPSWLLVIAGVVCHCRPRSSLPSQLHPSRPRLPYATSTTRHKTSHRARPLRDRSS